MDEDVEAGDLVRHYFHFGHRGKCLTTLANSQPLEMELIRDEHSEQGFFTLTFIKNNFVSKNHDIEFAIGN